MDALPSSACPIPRVVRQLLDSNPLGGEAGIDGASGYAWLWSGAKLLLWRYAEGNEPAVYQHTMAAPSKERQFITIVTYQSKSDVTVLACSEMGNITVWLNFLNPDPDQALLERVTGGVTAVTACRAPGDGFVAVLGTSAGTLYTVLSVEGNEGMRLEVKPLGGEGSNQQRSVLSRWLSSSREQAAAAVKVLQLCPVPEKPALLRLAVLREDAVECWQLSGDDDRLAWRHPLLQQLQGSNRGVGIALLDLSFVLNSPSRSRVVVLSSADSPGGDCQLSVHVLTEPESGSAAVVRSIDVTGVSGNFRFTPSPEADAFLFWRPRGLACAWSPAVGPLWIDSHGNCLAASVSSDGDSWLILTQQAGVVTTSIAPSRAHSRASTPAVSTAMPAAPVAVHQGTATAPPPGPKPLGYQGRTIVVRGPPSEASDMESEYGEEEGRPRARSRPAFKRARPPPTRHATAPSAVPGVALHSVPQTSGLQPNIPEEDDDDISELVMEKVSELLQGACFGNPVQGLRQILQKLGAFKQIGEDRNNYIATFSTRVVDALPKQWGAASGTASVLEQLAEKLRQHNALLQALASDDCLSELKSETLRVLFENGEKLAGLGQLREWENRAVASGQEGGPLQEVVELAGSQISQMLPAHVVGSRPGFEFFYACPTLSATRFFGIAARVVDLEHRGGPRPSATAALKRLSDLTAAIKVLVAGVGAQRGWQQHTFGAAATRALRGVGLPGWLAQDNVRDCLLALTRRAISLKAEVASEAPEKLSDHCQLAADLSELLLNAFAAAQAAADPSTEAREIAAGYAEARSESLRSLTEEAIGLCQLGASAGGQLLQRAESLAEAHHAYEQLVDICRYVGEPERLYRHMATLRPPLGATLGAGRDLYGHESCAAYVFSRLLAEGKSAEILSLPDELNSALKEWIGRQEPSAAILELGALHALRLRDYPHASVAYNALASKSANTQEARPAVALSELSALAAAPEGLQPLPRQVAEAVDAACGLAALLDVQDALGLGSGAVLAPRALLEEALNEACPPEALLLALDVFSAAGAPFRTENLGLMDAVWVRLLNGTDWDELATLRRSASDEQYSAMLATTPLAQAVRRCFSRDASLRSFCAGGRMEETVAPEHVATVLASVPLQAAAQMQAAFDIGLNGSELASEENTAMLMT